MVRQCFMIACRARPCRHKKNGEIALVLRGAFIYASKYALTLQNLKMSLGFGTLWDTQGTFRATQLLKFGFRLSIVSFDKFQDCGR